MARPHENVARLVGDKEGSMAHLVRIEKVTLPRIRTDSLETLVGRKSVDRSSRSRTGKPLAENRRLWQFDTPQKQDVEAQRALRSPGGPTI